MADGAVLARRYRTGRGADLRLPEMMRQAWFNVASTAEAWQGRAQTGAQYSSVEKHSAKATVLCWDLCPILNASFGEECFDDFFQLSDVLF